jgi:pilus assembly protein CpaB
MNARRLLSALLLALVGSAFFTFWLSRRFSKPAAPVAQKRQYVALAKAMDAGETLQKPALTMVDWPEASPVDGAFVKADDVAGRTLLYPVSAGEPITEKQLSAPGAAAGLSTHIPDGMRAISLKTDQIVGVAGFLLPGTRVDVLVTYRLPPSNIPITATVLQDAQILTAGQKMQPDPDGKVAPVDVVTLLVNPMDAERVVLASAQGTVHFVLRNGTDHQHVDGQSADLSELAGNMKAPAAPSVRTVSRGAVRLPVAAGPQPYVVHTVIGGKESSETFK